MAPVASITETEPMDAAHDDLFDIRAGKNCMGMVTFEYSFSRALDHAFIGSLEVLGKATFPLGYSGPIVKIDVPRLLLIEGIMGLRRLRITLRIGIEPNVARSVFEPLLAQAASGKWDKS